MSLKYKVIIIFLLITLIPLNILGMITYYQYSNTLEKHTYNYSTQIIDQVNQNINRYIEELHRMTLLPLYDKEVLEILNNHKYLEDYYYPLNNEIEKMNSFISTLIYKRPEIKGIQVITNDKNVFSNLGSSRVKTRYSTIEKEDWFHEVTEGGGKSQLIAAHNPSYYFGSPEEVFSVAKVIRQTNTFEHLGIIKIDIHLEHIQKILEEIKLSQDAIFLILDGKGRMIYQQIGNGHDKKRNDDIDNNLIRKNSNNLDINELITRFEGDSEIINLGNEAYLPVVNNTGSSGIKSIVLIPEKDILEDSRNLRIFTLYLILICIIIAIILALIVTRKITSPIIALRNKMIQTEKGYLNHRVPVHSNDEIGDLSKGYNRMMDEINKLIKQVYQTEIREKDAEIKALQSQINPHFIYNTLESINMMAIIHRKFDISDMISSLGNLIRYTVSQKSSLIKIREEIEFVRSYLSIQQLRFEDKLEVDIHFPPNVLDISIPKLILQPIIENAIVHGLDNGNIPGKITIDCWSEENLLYIRVVDSGKGLNSFELAQLRNRLYKTEVDEDPQSKHSGIALRNIHERIRLLFGESYGLEIADDMDQGTEITIRLPVES